MHFARLSIASFALADGCPADGPPFGSNLPQAFWADWKAGELGLIPELGSMLMLIWPPEDLGSGKLDTPCERMHWENLSPAAWRLGVAALGVPDDPHAAIARADPTASTAIEKTCRRLLRAVPVAALRMSGVSSGSGGPAEL